MIVPGFEPGSAAPPEERERGERTGRGHKHEPRTGRGPKTPIDHLPEPAAHLPKLPRVPKQPMIAADGFDFSKPYAPQEGSIEANPASEEKSAPAERHAERHPRRPLRPVAALLGGIGKK